MIESSFVSDYLEEFKDLSIDQLFIKLDKHFADKICLASSLSVEDQILTYVFLKVNPKANIFVLDTGRLHAETLSLLKETEKKYSFSYQIYYPNQQAVDEMVSYYGKDLFYESIENRKRCCHVRKVEPLKRALSSKKAWITGLRAQQSVTRTDLSLISWDASFDMVKVNPLLYWTDKQLWDFVSEHDIPVNALHHKGYPSIGCEPCTRAIKPGEDVRAGRWWWEQADQRECGLHIQKKLKD